ncbi:conserved hypothetical protein [Halorhabdus utahensis DSM 12940]|uniref:KaiC-like domain-containing protein n=1 Tax=Halorhabdus utahensis (strain DSM 12940 / JCM 11049 / AX-2) TaxID=519442 RepID=C7NPH6_HALUD|nr:hypothetical protein [Halorhabdus utahensis]ACV12731.1 conserved hypothetical protein [Halorhabdus utahensis DSM 12940]
MSLRNDAFETAQLPIDDIESGQSILLVGDDTTALKTVFARLVAADADERSVVLATNAGGRSIQRLLDDARDGAGSRASILTAEGPGRGADVSTIDDLKDITQVGMQFSNLVGTSQQSTARFRSGIFLCSTIVSELDDTRSVYRFLNSNFLTELRRGDGIGVVAIDRSAELETDVDSMVTGMETSFNIRIDVEQTGPQTATLHLSGVPGSKGPVDITL